MISQINIASFADNALCLLYKFDKREFIYLWQHKDCHQKVNASVFKQVKTPARYMIKRILYRAIYFKFTPFKDVIKILVEPLGPSRIRINFEECRRPQHNRLKYNHFVLHAQKQLLSAHNRNQNLELLLPQDNIVK